MVPPLASCVIIAGKRSCSKQVLVTVEVFLLIWKCREVRSQDLGKGVHGNRPAGIACPPLSSLSECGMVGLSHLLDEPVRSQGEGE